jgi:hypothetical protein
MYNRNKLDIIVIATKKRRPLIAPYLKDLNPIISYTPDYELPENFEPAVKGLTHNHLGTYRCFKGHQQAINKATKECALIFEDDAVPNRTDWLHIINENLELLNAFDVVSFHGRDYDKNAFSPFLSPHSSGFIWARDKQTWIVGALVYLVGRENYERMINFAYDGTPWDLVLYRNFSYCLMQKSPFNHDRSQGSLVD